MDVHDKETRSYNMSCIKGKNTRPEEIVRKYLFLRDSDTERMTRDYPEHQILFYLNIRQ